MDFRLYREDDFTQLYEIELTCFELPIRFTRQTMQQFVTDAHSATWIAEEHGQMTGFAIVYWAKPPEQPLAYIQTLEVAPAHRNRGVAWELLRRVEESARAAGAHVIWLHVAETNAAAISLYERHGYSLQGREPNYYAKNTSALLYAKAID
jgi:ribosomal protein S18 acetylase RimI-like enzyme